MSNLFRKKEVHLFYNLGTDKRPEKFPVSYTHLDVYKRQRQHDLTELLKPAEDIVIDTSLLTVPDCPQQETE